MNFLLFMMVECVLTGDPRTFLLVFLWTTHRLISTDLYFPFELIFKALEYLQSYDSEEKSLTSHPFLFCHTHCDLISATTPITNTFGR